MSETALYLSGKKCEWFIRKAYIKRKIWIGIYLCMFVFVNVGFKGLNGIPTALGHYASNYFLKKYFKHYYLSLLRKSKCVSLTKFEISIEKKPTPSDQKLILKIFFSTKCSRNFATCLHNIFHILSIQFWYSNIEIHFLKIRWNKKGESRSSI